jgi:hypothetical protein
MPVELFVAGIILGYSTMCVKLYAMAGNCSFKLA